MSVVVARRLRKPIGVHFEYGRILSFRDCIGDFRRVPVRA
jgi:hypothetical protein